jgi:hypothetical protein
MHSLNSSHSTNAARWIRPVVAAVAMLPIHGALGGDLLGLYVGGSVGQSHVQATGEAFNGSFAVSEAQFSANHSAYKFVAGLRPISPLGVEVAYIDFGHPTGTIATPGKTAAADATMKGAAAFGVWYLPVPIVDVYVKAGLARLQSKVASQSQGPELCIPCVSFFEVSRTNTSGAAGAGAQFKLGSWAVRGEYERFNAAGGNPGLFSLGLTWTFL